MFLPVGMAALPVAMAEVADLRARVRGLEQALVALAAGPTAGDPAGWAAAEADLADIGRLVRAGELPQAARQLREVLGVTWDQAHAAVRSWPTNPQPDLVRQVWLRRWLAEQRGPDADGDAG